MKRIAMILILSALAATAATASDSTTVSTPRDEHRARMEKAIEARDYDAWKAERDAWGAKGQAGQKVTKDNFETFVKMHDAVKAGRTDEAAALRKELGLQPGKGGMGAGQGKCAKHGNGAGGGQGQGNGKGLVGNCPHPQAGWSVRRIGHLFERAGS